MRTLCLILAATVILVFNARAEEETNCLPRTDIEAFEAQTNTVIVKGMSSTAAINMSTGTISVRSKESIDVTTGRKAYGMVLEFSSNGEGRIRALVDYNELDSMITGIDYLNRISPDATPLASFDAVYTTKSGFRIIAYSSRRQGNVQTFIQFDGCPRITLTSDQVSQFRDLVNSAKNSLDSLQASR